MKVLYNQVVNKHKQIIEKLTSAYKNQEETLAFVLTGSVARDEATEVSDLDLLLIASSKQPFKEEVIDGIVVEIKTNTEEGFIQKMKNEPMNVYQWLDAKVIFDKGDYTEKVINEAKNIYENYIPDTREVKGVKKWLESALIKIKSTKDNNDNLALGFNLSNNLWTIVRGLYLLNNKPVPPSSTAFRRIKELKKLPDDFDNLWNEMLTGDLQTRTKVTLQIINIIIS